MMGTDDFVHTLYVLVVICYGLVLDKCVHIIKGYNTGTMVMTVPMIVKQWANWSHKSTANRL